MTTNAAHQNTPYFTLLFLMLVALGGAFTEHSGVINIALEGTMTIGGLVGVLVLVVLPPGHPRLYNSPCIGAGCRVGRHHLHITTGFRLREP